MIIKNLDKPEIRYEAWLMRSENWQQQPGIKNVLNWALRKDFYKEKDWQSDIFIDVAENGHIKILELADRKELHWYHRNILVGAVARTDLDPLDFILNKKPTKFNLSFTRMCAREGFIVVMEWWKQMELIELFSEAVYS
jgi:hypothetical protein